MIKMICAMDAARGIGRNNQLLVRIPEDLRRFRQLTTGHHVVMGRKTFESIGKPLPERTNWVLKRNPDMFGGQLGVRVVSRPEAILELHEKQPELQIFIIGGGELYRWFLPYADELLLTVIDDVYEADVTFPEYTGADWLVTSEEKHHFMRDGDLLHYTFIDLQRIAHSTRKIGPFAGNGR